MEVETRRGDHRAAHRGILAPGEQTAGSTEHRANDSAVTADHQTAAGPIFEILDRVATTTDQTRLEGRDDAMTGIPDNAAFQTYVMLRCNRWGLTQRWVTRVGVTDPRPFPMTSWWGPIVLDGNVEQLGIDSVRDVCPWDLDEAAETARCVMELPEYLRDTLVEEHVKRGTKIEKAARLGIESRAYRKRLTVAYTLLLDLFQAAAVGLPLEIDYRAPGRPKQTD